jgi:hypothetical protein
MPNASMPKHSLAEVFGFPATDMSANANRHRTKRLCPFNNIRRPFPRRSSNNQNEGQTEALKKGMQEKSREFTEKGSELYAKA